MPDEHDDDIEPDEGSAVIKELRAKAKRLDEAEAKVVTLERQVAIGAAGLSDLNPTQQKALMATHEGDLTPEALKATAATLGFAQTAATDEVVVDEAGIARAQQATAGAPPAASAPEALEALMAKAKTPAELEAILNSAGVQTQFE